MIKLLRVDHRLLHGQVAFAWTGHLDADAILIANDDVAVNDLRKATIRLARPQGVKLVMKSIDDSVEAIKSSATDKYKLFIVVENVEDAYRIASQIDEIDLVNLGGCKATPETESFSRNVNLTSRDQELLRELVKLGKDVEIRTVPSESAKKFI